MNMKDMGTESLIICNLEEPAGPEVRESVLNRMGSEDKFARAI
jgi:hypothetical protein